MMVNRIDSKTDGNPNKLSRHDAVAINYLSETRISTRSQPKHIDDLIVSLANAHENARARQVTEWETMRQSGMPPEV